MGEQTPVIVGRIVSLQVGRPKAMKTPQGRAWTSAIVKAAVDGRVTLRSENLDGDDQANRKYHGGPDKAVCAYPAEHFPEWRAEFDLPDMGAGAFGENFTVEGLTEEAVCLGDVFAVGTAVVQVSQPRMPCVNVARRWDRPKLPVRMEENGRTGYYLRVLTEGEVAAGDTLTLQERSHPDWTVLRANHTLYGDAATPAEIAELRDLPGLTGEWRRALGRKLRKQI
jgi:MOSC domain-containing protein YiiM